MKYNKKIGGFTSEYGIEFSGIDFEGAEEYMDMLGANDNSKFIFAGLPNKVKEKIVGVNDLPIEG